MADISLKKAEYNYKKIAMLRELLIEELRSQFSTITVEGLKLVEMRLQSIIMAGGLTEDEVKTEVEKSKN